MRALPALGPLFLALSLASFTVACGAEAANDAPILDSVDSPLAVHAANGVYRIPVSVGFHDNDGEAVTHVRYRVAPSIDRVVEIAMPNPTRQTAEVMLEIPAAEIGGGGGARAVEITVLDGRGAESRPLPRMVALH